MDRTATSAIRDGELDRPPAAGTGGAGARVGILLERRYRGHAQPAGVAAELRARGHRVVLIDPAHDVVDVAEPAWCEGLDVLLCRGRSAAVLALLGVAHRQGVACVNSPDAIAAVLNKAHAGAILAAAGIAVPPTFLGSTRELAAIPAAVPPLILKPICGDNATGLRVVWSRPALRVLDWPEGVALAQRFVPTDGTDLKLYVAGDRVWAVRRRSPIDSRDGSPVTGPVLPGDPVPVTPALAALARRCGEVTGLELFGVDCADGPDGPVVLEVNDYPNYTGVPGADAAIADLALRRIGV
jgi:ribosomal protein S6--L-glutamate ligase